MIRICLLLTTAEFNFDLKDQQGNVHAISYMYM